MEGDLSPAQIKELVQQTGINTPIMSYRVVGDRVELRLLGGERVEAELGAPAGEFPSDLLEDTATIILDSMNHKDLYALAQQYKIRGRSNMSDDELRQALLKAMS